MSQIGTSSKLAAKATVLNNHILGEESSVQHESASIKIDPTLEINSTTVEDVRDAIVNLSDYIDSINVDAETYQKGFILIANDLGGSGSSPNVIKITGDGSNQIFITPRNLVFDANEISNVEIKFSAPATTPVNLKITGQTASIGSPSKGGDITIESGGRGVNYGLRGSIFLNLSTTNILTAKFLTATTKIISLFGDATTSNVTGSANDTLFIFNTTNDPSNNPVDGTHLYSKSGKVRVKNSNGDTFNVGDTPNIWTNNYENIGTINKIGTSLVATGIPEIISSYTNSNNCIVLVTAKLVAKVAGSNNEAASFIINASFYQDGGGMTEIGVNNLQFQRDEAGTYSNIPLIQGSGSSIEVLTGYHDTDNTYWLAHVEYTIDEI